MPVLTDSYTSVFYMHLYLLIRGPEFTPIANYRASLYINSYYSKYKDDLKIY